MAAYVVRRVIWALITLLLAVSAVFVLFYVIPGGGGRRTEGGISPVAVLLAGRNGSPAEMRAIESELGLDRPVPVQYARYLSRLARGDLGFSFAAGVPVSSVVAPAVPPSVSIAVGASAVWLAAGVAIGVVSARRRGTWGERVTMVAALAGLSLPVFVVALVGLALLLQLTGIYAGNRYVPITQSPLGWFEAMWLPWISLAFPLIAVYARMVRTEIIEIQEEDYIRTSWAKGLSESQVLRHELRSGLAPIVTMYGLDFGLLLGGSVIIESIFRIPGLGSLLLQARDFYDFPVMAGVVIIFSASVIVANLLVDLFYRVIDPRVRLGESIEAAGGGPRM